MTNSEIVSRIINGAKALDKDSHISRRYVLNVARSKATFLMSQKLLDKTLYREDDLIKHLPCFPLKKISRKDCGIVEFKLCKSIMKSKDPIPGLIYSRYGNSIISISSIDGSELFYPITLKKYNLNQRREHASLVKQKYYYIKDGYLYLPDSEIEMVDIDLISLEPEKLNDISECETADCCKSAWDSEFVCSDKLLEAVITDTRNEVLSALNIPKDENPNMDSNIKSQTSQ
jgi:hypothetical protein